MKKLVALLAALICGAHQTACAQVDANLVAKFLNTAKAASDSQLGTIAGELTGKAQALGATAIGDAAKNKLNGALMLLTGGKDSAALISAFDLVKEAKLTPEQLGFAKQVGNLASAYVMQKNFATLEGSQSDVATLVKSLREGKLTAAIAPVKNIAGNTHLTDSQKKLVKTVADKYAPGWEKAKGAVDATKGAVDAVKKLPGF
jgi:hypothetical protein